jgi:hypothetical protein
LWIQLKTALFKCVDKSKLKHMQYTVFRLNLIAWVFFILFVNAWEIA